MYVAAKEVLKFRFLMKTCGTWGPWRLDEKVGLAIKKTCGNCAREGKKKQEKKRD
jgi:hypothetical protein